MQKSFIKAVLTFVIALLCVVPAAQAQEAPNLQGSWTSVALENYGNHYGKRAFEFTDTTWQVTHRAYADAQGKQPLFRLNVGGVYVLGQASSSVPGAFEGIFPATYRHVTAESEAGVQMFAAMGCTLKLGEETSLVSQGCGFVHSLMQAMGEYDLVSLKDGKLFLGDRAGDLTRARPTALTPYPAVRK